MAEVHAKHLGSVLGVEEVEPTETDKYGIVDTRGSTEQVAAISAIVEKPKPALAPSNLAVVGRYVLTPAIFDHLENIGAGAGGEIQLTDGIARLMQDEPVYAYRFQGKRYDCGSKLGYLQATVEFGLKHSKLGAPFRAYLQQLMHGQG
jgi:UTP--glucose-1-phosphate uridylyltransferase